MNTMKENLAVDVTLDDANKVMGIPKKTAFEQLCSLHQVEVSAEQIDGLVFHFNERLTAQYAEKGSIELMPHAGELFESIRACGSQVYLNTGFNRAIADVIVQNLNLGNVLNGYIGSDEVMAGRPQPDMIRLAMKRSGVEYSHFVMKVGDTISDLYEGFSAGCAWNVGVLTVGMWVCSPVPIPTKNCALHRILKFYRTYNRCWVIFQSRAVDCCGRANKSVIGLGLRVSLVLQAIADAMCWR